MEAKHKKMKALHYQTQKEQKNLEERLAQEEVGKKCSGQARSHGKALGTRLYSGANLHHKVNPISKTLMKTVRETATEIEP